MTPAVIYARYSSTNQREESIEGQIRECRRYAERVGLTVIHEYTDAAISGTSDKRPAFQQMIRDAKTKAFEVVLVWKLDRFARNRYDAAIYRNKLQESGVRLVSAMETFSDGPEGIILEGLMEAMAEYYSANLSENVSRGMYDSALQRRWLGPPMLGYKKGTDGRYEIDPLTAPIVTRIFEEHAAGTPEAEIIAGLNRDGIRTARNRPFTKNSLRTVLTNEKYVGMYRYKDIEDPEGVPAIVSRELFDKAQDFHEKRKFSKRRRDDADRYILTSKLICGHCGKWMTGESARSRHGYIVRYYSCIGHKNRRHDCDKKRVSKEWIESEVIRIVTDEILKDEFIELIADAFINKRSTDPNEEKKKTLERQIHDVQRKIDNINRAIADGIWSESTAEMLRTLEDQKYKLTAALHEAQLVPPEVTREEIIQILTDMRSVATRSDDIAQALIDGFVSKIYLFDDPENKKGQRVLVEYSPTGYVKDSVQYEEMLRVRAEHFYPHLNTHTRTSFRIQRSLFVEYCVRK